MSNPYAKGAPINKVYNQREKQLLNQAITYLMENDFDWGYTEEKVMNELGLLHCKMRRPRPCVNKACDKNYEKYCTSCNECGCVNKNNS